MYYLIERNYVGPNPTENIDADEILISIKPAVNNDGEEQVSGPCGSSGIWSTAAHGQFSTLKEAEEAVTALFGETRDADDLYEYDEDITACYQKGRYRPLSTQQAADALYSTMLEDITPETDDSTLLTLAAEYEKEANADGCTLTAIDVIAMMREFQRNQ